MSAARGIVQINSATPLDVTIHGERAARLNALARAGAPVPRGVAVSCDRVQDIAAALPDICAAVQPLFEAGACLVVHPSPADLAWGGPLSAHNIGYTQERFAAIAKKVGREAAEAGYCALVRDYAVAVSAADVGRFDTRVAEAASTGHPSAPSEALPSSIATALGAFEAETGTPFPGDPCEQLAGIIGAMVRDWTSPTARILRTANGAPEDAPLGLVIQVEVAAGVTGYLQGIDPGNGAKSICGSIRKADGSENTDISTIGGAERSVLEMALKAGDAHLKDAARIQFAISEQGVSILDLATAKRSDTANLQVIVDLVKDGVLGRDQALLKANPRTITAHLHAHISDGQPRDVLAEGIAASTGAGQGPFYFTTDAVQAAAARGSKAILVRNETEPEDIRGMTTAAGVLTLTGGLTSHAAVIAQGLGVPCVVGASDLRIDLDEGELVAPGGRRIKEGETITVDGASGEIIAGAPKLERPEVSHAFTTIMDWADEVREMGVRANADTLHEARAALSFGVDGIGLCRTEHMFYESDRINVMRELILAEDTETRQSALDRLLPIQRDDFCDLFEIMGGLPVTIRLLDPPLHEFLPSSGSDIKALSQAMDVPIKTLRRRIDEMGEFNPMLGMRGVRLAVTMPEIYEMQARAIFEAALFVGAKTGTAIVPEIMIPLVSAHREVDLVKARLDAVARTVEAEKGARPRYRLGVMVETPRAALRAGDLAVSSAFLSFGTNDLTQMTYGLSRDDSGRFMREYVNEGVFLEDPFLTLDLEGVGELLLTATRRGRRARPQITLGLCGEHGGDPASVRFCQVAGFAYVSCSPYRVPIARLAAAQATLLAEPGESDV